MRKKQEFHESETMNSTVPVEMNLVKKELHPLNLHLDLGRQDLNDNFHKIQEKINELINHVK